MDEGRSLTLGPAGHRGPTRASDPYRGIVLEPTKRRSSTAIWCPVPDDLPPNVVSDTIAEQADPAGISAERVRARLADWQARVHALYADIERALGSDYTIDRTGKHRSNEELVQLAKIPEAEVPPVDILSIADHSGKVRAIILPRALWIIGANGALQLRLFRLDGRQAIYTLLDGSRPLIPPASWVIAPYSDPSDRQPFSGNTLGALLAR